MRAPRRGLRVPGQDRFPRFFPFPDHVLQKLLFPDALRELYSRVQSSDQSCIWQGVLQEMQVECEVSDSDLKNIPSAGPLVVVANHPFGMIEGAILGSTLARVRSDVKVMTNYLLAGIPELRQGCIFVDPFRNRRSPLQNRRGIRESLEWLSNGGVLVIFPAGEVSSWDLRTHRVTDPKWSDTAARLARTSGAAVLPVYVKGENSLPFHLLGFVHPRLRTVRLPQELLNKRGKTIEIRIGSDIPAEQLAALQEPEAATQYLRWRTYLLAERNQQAPKVHRIRLRKPEPPREVMAAIAKDVLRHEIAQLPLSQKLVESREFSVYTATSSQIPALMMEIGRLREVTFRAAGEGTGRAYDLDAYDSYYDHLFLWSNVNQELAGAYRIGRVDEILAKHGVQGLYTSSLFRYDPELFRRIGPALELGRSFICEAYQKQYSSLLVLWKGIAEYVAQRPETAVLLGAVSVSNNYHAISRELLVRYFETRSESDELERFLKPRMPFRARRIPRSDIRVIASALRTVEDISEPISDIELDHKGVPILFRQYLKLGGRLLGFNVDPSFSDVVDGLVLVDLLRTDPKVLSRYMSAESLKAFHSFHDLKRGTLSGAYPTTLA
jgi:putative hemolysin